MLQERTPDVNISHRKMPSWERHVEYVNKHVEQTVIFDGDGRLLFEPHRYWFLVESKPGGIVGQVYLTARNEIGIQIFWAQQRRGYGSAALDALLEVAGPGEYLANVNPKNKPSAHLWLSRGFSLVQHTYRGTLKS